MWEKIKEWFETLKYHRLSPRCPRCGAPMMSEFAICNNGAGIWVKRCTRHSCDYKVYTGGLYE